MRYLLSENRYLLWNFKTPLACIVFFWYTNDLLVMANIACLYLFRSLGPKYHFGRNRFQFCMVHAKSRKSNGRLSTSSCISFCRSATRVDVTYHLTGIVSGCLIGKSHRCFSTWSSRRVVRGSLMWFKKRRVKPDPSHLTRSSYWELLVQDLVGDLFIFDLGGVMIKQERKVVRSFL